MSIPPQRPLPPPRPGTGPAVLPSPAARRPGGSAAIGDPLLDERLARLAARSSAHRSGPTNQPSGTAAAGPSGRRHHAARGSRAAALALSLGTTVGLAGYLRALEAPTADLSSADATSATTASSTTATTATSPVTDQSTTSATAATTATTAPAQDPAAQDAAASSSGGGASSAADASTTNALADGTFTGDTFTNRWGNVQVQITISGGSVSDVTVLQAPDGDRKSVSINNRAVPQLVEATLSAQSADIDTVSGATYTSDSYRQSLQSALDEARAAVNA